VLRDAGRDHNDPDSPNLAPMPRAYAAIASLFPAPGSGSIETQARDIRTKSGGDISILTPGGGLQLAASLIGETLAPPGIITESGGSISIFANDSVSASASPVFSPCAAVTS
jgi:filamentous hemagglutinin